MVKLYHTKYKKLLILFICTSNEQSICREKIMWQYEVATNEKYKLFLYLYVAKQPKVYKGLYFPVLLSHTPVVL